jgi:hypothetical protein
MADTAAAGVCHIHPPAVDGQPPELIGPYADATRCERERRLRFGPAGRCHCTAAFTPDWLGPNAANPRSPAGGDRRLPTAGGEHPVPLP